MWSKLPMLHASPSRQVSGASLGYNRWNCKLRIGRKLHEEKRSHNEAQTRAYGHSHGSGQSADRMPTHRILHTSTIKRRRREDEDDSRQRTRCMCVDAA